MLFPPQKLTTVATFAPLLILSPLLFSSQHNERQWNPITTGQNAVAMATIHRLENWLNTPSRALQGEGLRSALSSELQRAAGGAATDVDASSAAHEFKLRLANLEETVERIASGQTRLIAMVESLVSTPASVVGTAAAASTSTSGADTGKADASVPPQDPANDLRRRVTRTKEC